MRFRTVVSCIALALPLAASCGSSDAPAPSTPKMTAPASGAQDTDKVVIVSRTAPVPEATTAGEKLVYVKAGSVWMMGPDGDAAEQLTVRSLDAADQAPAVSPDGTHLAYASAKEGPLSLYIQNMEDMIPSSLGEGRDPAWSPDGTQLAFMRGDERVGLDLYVLKLDGESEPRLVFKGDDDMPGLSGTPVWSPSGEHIIMSADRRQHQGSTLWKVHVATGTATALTPPDADAPWTSDREPAIAPDGKTIAFASNRHGSSSDDAGDYDVYTIGMDGAQLIRLTDDPGTIATPAYSADGQRLYFASTRIRKADYEWEIFVMAASGGEQRRLTREERPENSAPSLAILPARSE